LAAKDAANSVARFIQASPYGDGRRSSRVANGRHGDPDGHARNLRCVFRHHHERTDGRRQRLSSRADDRRKQRANGPDSGARDSKPGQN
jgi:hypothetical protein